MDKWQNFFAPTILNRGQNYFKQRKVKSLHFNQDRLIWEAFVQGSRKYRVRIRVAKNGDLLGIGCSCPYAAQGDPCKHLAAVFFALTARNLVKNTNSPNGVSIFEKQRASYKLMTELKAQVKQQLTPAYYFDLNTILKKVRIDDETFQTALALKKNHNFTAIKFRLQFSQDQFSKELYRPYEQMIEASGLTSNHISANLTLKRDQIVDLNCNLCNRYGDFCEHTVILLLQLVDGILANNPGDFTNFAGLNLLDDWQAMKTQQNQASLINSTQKQSISLLPEIIDFHGASLLLRLKIGETGKRFYQVKDLFQLIKDFKQQATVRLGKKQMLTLATKQITSDSLPLYHFLCRNLQPLIDLKNQLEQFQAGGSLFDLTSYGSSAILLGPTALDDFFQTFKGQTITFKGDHFDAPIALKLLEGHFNLEVQLKKLYDEHNNFQGLKLAFELPPLYLGEKAAYLAEEEAFYCIPLPRQSIFKYLIEQNHLGQLEDITIGKQNLAEFYYDQLPQWRQDPQIKVIEPALTAAEMPIKETFTFLLDMNEEFLTCQAWINEQQETKNLLEQVDGLRMHVSRREKKLQADLTGFFAKTDSKNQTYQLDFSDEHLFQLLTEIIPKLQAYGTVKVSAALKKISIKSAPKVSVGVKLQGNLLELNFSNRDFSPAELQQIFSQYQLKKKFYRLANGSFVNLTDGNLATVSKLQHDLQLPAAELFTGDNQLGANHAFFLNQYLKSNQVELDLQADQQFEQLIKQFEKIQQQHFSLPLHLKATLRPYQLAGYQWLRTLTASHFSGILADEMGLGKTLQIITLLLANQQEKFVVPKTSLIVTPASLIYNWQAELTKFAPQLKVVLLAGSQNERQTQLQALAETKPDIVITSYDLLKRDLKQYQAVDFGFEIIDEAQYIKNPRTSAAKAVKQLSSQIRFALTGTPIENSLSELWSIFDFLMPGFLGTYHDFRSYYENPIIKDQQTATQQKLNQLVSPFILRRLKHQVLKDLPAKTEQVYLVEMESKQQTLYHAQTSLLKRQVENQSEQEFNQSKIEILAELTRLREICCDPALVYDNYHRVSAKRLACMELMQQAIGDGHKILVFSQFVSLLKLLATDLQRHGLEYYQIFGSTPKKERTVLAQKFNQDQTPVFLISLKAGGTGLNLTGADVVIHFDPWWNLAAQNQATDRAHRIGQQNKVNVYSLISKNSIEEKVLQLQAAKKQLADNLLNNQKVTSAKLTKQDLLQILK